MGRTKCRGNSLIKEIKACKYVIKKKCPKKDKCTYRHWDEGSSTPIPVSSKSFHTDQRKAILSSEVLTTSASLPTVASKLPILKAMPKLDEDGPWPLAGTNQDKKGDTLDTVGTYQKETRSEHAS